jgi:hypothetical protein
MLGTSQTSPKWFETDCTSTGQGVLGERFHRARTLIWAGQDVLEVLEAAVQYRLANGKRNVSRRFAVLPPWAFFRRFTCHRGAAGGAGDAPAR